MATRLILVSTEPDASERIELVAPLDANNCLDPKRWAEQPESWPATRVRGEAPAMSGLLRYYEDGGWSLPFFDGPADPDAPLTALTAPEQGFTLGGFVSLRDPDRTVRSWQVVSMG